jgi:hypothetical protein
MGWDFESRFNIIKFIIKLFLYPLYFLTKAFFVPFHENADALMLEMEIYKTAYEVELTSDCDRKTFYLSAKCHRFQKFFLMNEKTLEKFILFLCRKT